MKTENRYEGGYILLNDDYKVNSIYIERRKTTWLMAVFEWIRFQVKTTNYANFGLMIAILSLSLTINNTLNNQREMNDLSVQYINQMSSLQSNILVISQLNNQSINLINTLNDIIFYYNNNGLGNITQIINLVLYVNSTNDYLHNQMNIMMAELETTVNYINNNLSIVNNQISLVNDSINEVEMSLNESVTSYTVDFNQRINSLISDFEQFVYNTTSIDSDLYKQLNFSHLDIFKIKNELNGSTIVSLNATGQTITSTGDITEPWMLNSIMSATMFSDYSTVTSCVMTLSSDVNSIYIGDTISSSSSTLSRTETGIIIVKNGPITFRQNSCLTVRIDLVRLFTISNVNF